MKMQYYASKRQLEEYQNIFMQQISWQHKGALKVVKLIKIFYLSLFSSDGIGWVVKITKKKVPKDLNKI